MPKRTKTGQARHDRAVLRSARSYKVRGYNVKADLPGYTKPKKIGGHVPDILATKGRKEKIVEVETRDSNKKDASQHSAFKSYADKKASRDFRKRII